MTACAACDAELEQTAGPGRPKLYCSEPCRRLIEFRIRALARRLEKYELHQRDIKAGIGPYLDDEERQRRLRALRRWIKLDTASLRSLLGGNNQDQSSLDGEARP